MCSFKANQAIKIASEYIYHWRVYTQLRARQRYAINHMAFGRAYRQCQRIVKEWSIHSKEQGRVKRLARNHRSTQNMKIMRLVFSEMRRYAHTRREKNTTKSEASRAFAKAICKKVLRSMRQFATQSKEKHRERVSLSEEYASRLKAKVFYNMARMCKKLSLVAQKGRQVRALHSSRVRLATLREWHFCCLVLQHATRHRQFRLKRQWFGLLCDAVCLHNEHKQKKLKAQRFRDRSLKFELLWFLREFAYEQETKRRRCAMLTEQGEHIHHHHLLNGFFRQLQS